MRPTLMLQAIVQRIFFSNFAELQNADAQLHNFQKYSKVIANELKLGIIDLELVFHQTSESAIVTPKTHFKTSYNQQDKIRQALYRIFTKQSVLEYSEENKKKVVGLLYKLRKDQQLKLMSELILLANQLYYYFSQNLFRKCVDLFQKQEVSLRKKGGYIECAYIQSKIYSSMIMLKMRINDDKSIDDLFQRAFELRQQALNCNFYTNKSSFMKRSVYLKIKHVEILIQKENFTKAMLRFQEYQNIFAKDQQSFTYLKNVLMSRVTGMRKIVDEKLKQRVIKRGEKSEVSLPETPRERSRSTAQFLRLNRAKSKNQGLKKKEVYVDLSNPFYRIKRAKSNNTLNQVQLEEMYKNVKEVKDKKLFPSDITNQLNKIRESINNRGTAQPDITKKRAISRATSKSKSSIYPSRKTDLRLQELRILHSLPALNTIKFLFLDYNTPSMCTVNLDEQQKFQIMTLEFEGHSMKKEFNKINDPEELQSQWSSLKYVFRKYLRGDEIFRQIDKYTKIPNQDVSQEIISKYYKCKFQNFDIVQIVELKQLIKTFLCFTYFKFKEVNGYKIAFVRKLNWENIVSRVYLKKRLNQDVDMDEVIKTTPKFNLLFAKLPSKVYGFQYTISREFKVYEVIVYFKRQYFENHIYKFSDIPARQEYLEVDVRFILPSRDLGSHSKVDKSSYKEYRSVKIPLALLTADQGIEPRQVSRFLLDILINNYYNKYLIKYFIKLFIRKSSITYQQQLIFSFQKNNKLFEDPFNTIPRNSLQDTSEVNVVITEIQQPYLTKIETSKRRFNSYLVRKLSSMSPDEEMESLKDTCTYVERKLSKYFNGHLYVVEIRILRERKRTNRQWEWAAYFYINNPSNKITHKLSINSNDEKLLGLQNELMRDLSLEDKVNSLFNYLCFISRGPYRSLCIKYPNSNFIHTNCINYLRIGKKNLGLISKYELCRSCQYTKVIKVRGSYVVMSVYHLRWNRKMIWEIEFSFGTGEIWICEMNIDQIFGFLVNREGEGIEVFSETKNEWMLMWKEIFKEDIKFVYDGRKEENYFKLRNQLFKIEERLTILSTKYNEASRHIDIKLVSNDSLFKSYSLFDKNDKKEREFKINVHQENQVLRAQITYRQLDAMFKFQNNGQLLSENRKSYRVLVEFIIQKLQQILIRAKREELWADK